MDPTVVKEYAPIIKKILTANALLILFYLLPNLTSFLVTLLLINLLKPEYLSLGTQSKTAINNELSINDYFNSYLNASVNKSIYTLIQKS